MGACCPAPRWILQPRLLLVNTTGAAEHRIKSRGRQRGSGAEGEGHTGVVVRRSFLLRLPGRFAKLNMPIAALGRRTALCRRGGGGCVAAASAVVQPRRPPAAPVLPLQRYRHLRCSCGAAFSHRVYSRPCWPPHRLLDDAAVREPEARQGFYLKHARRTDSV